MIELEFDDISYKWNLESQNVVVSTYKKVKEVIFGMNTVDYVWSDDIYDFFDLPVNIQDELLKIKAQKEDK